MPDLHLIGPVPASTTGTSRSPCRTLPYDLLKEASNRLGIISLVGALIWVLGPALYHLADWSSGDPHWLQLRKEDAICGASLLISLGFFFYARRGDKDPKFLLDLGLVYMVLTALALGLLLYCDPLGHDLPKTPMISWIGAVVLMFAAIVPNSPEKILVAGFIAASMNPLSMLAARAYGNWDFGPTITVLLVHSPDYLMVGVSVVISHVVTKLGYQVTQAREMGSYRLETLLGKGGMGEVWRARHRMLARDAAVKLIQPEMLSRNSGSNAAMMRRRFEQEVKTTASLRSPHTVQLYDFGVTEDGTFYYVMELLDGIDLETLVKNFGPLPAARVVNILRQVCRSLSDAHRHGMIHRDIKPTNIFLCRMGSEYDFAKVLDFGLVKRLDGNETMTVDGVSTGTPAYMAPELALGSEAIDGRTDLYGLGCVAYWLITGGLVFEEKGTTAMMLAHVRKAPVMPSEKSKLPVPAALDRAIMMCLAKEPVERPASVEIFARMLDSCDNPVSWTQEDSERWWKTNMPEEAVYSSDRAKPEHTESATLTKSVII